MKPIIPALFLLVAMVGCSQDYRRYAFVTVDCSKKTIVKLKAQSDKSGIHTIRLHIEGRVDGKAILAWTDGPKTEEVSGNVRLNWSNEWYQPDCEISYSPVGAASGELRIYYKFETI